MSSCAMEAIFIRTLARLPHGTPPCDPMLMMITQSPRAALVMWLSELALVLVTVTSAVPTAFASWSVEWHKDEG